MEADVATLHEATHCDSGILEAHELEGLKHLATIFPGPNPPPAARHRGHTSGAPLAPSQVLVHDPLPKTHRSCSLPKGSISVCLGGSALRGSVSIKAH